MPQETVWGGEGGGSGRRNVLGGEIVLRNIAYGMGGGALKGDDDEQTDSGVLSGHSLDY